MLEHRTNRIHEEPVTEEETTGVIGCLITFNLNDHTTNRGKTRKRVLNITLGISDHVVTFL